MEMQKVNYIVLISRRGNRYGGDGGTLDLLIWCNKPNLRLVTEDEARRFWENPDASYGEA